MIKKLLSISPKRMLAFLSGTGAVVIGFVASSEVYHYILFAVFYIIFSAWVFKFRVGPIASAFLSIILTIWSASSLSFSFESVSPGTMLQVIPFSFFVFFSIIGLGYLFLRHKDEGLWWTSFLGVMFFLMTSFLLMLLKLKPLVVFLIAAIWSIGIPIAIWILIDKRRAKAPPKPERPKKSFIKTKVKK